MDAGRPCGRSGVELFELARFMGTSVDQIDRTCGHLLPDSRDRARAALDALVTAQAAQKDASGGLGTQRARAANPPEARKRPLSRAFPLSGRSDLNRRPLVPQAV